MPVYMLDTNICIYIRTRRPIRVLEKFRAVPLGDAVISAVTYGELLVRAEKGVSRDRDIATIDAFTKTVSVTSLTPDAAEHYAAIRAHLERRGETIGNNDLWIAAHARSAGLTLVTNNEREYRRVPDLVVENWAAAA